MKKETDWRAIVGELLGEFNEDAERIGTYIKRDEPRRRAGDPIMVHAASLDPKRYREISKLIERS